MNLFKAIVPGALLTWVVSTAIGSQGSRGAWLAIERLHLNQHSIYWSWPLFVAGTVLAWAMFAMTPK
ncbi:MAG: hypothetical protein EBR34_14275 [Sphingomonadaceae bacterium]|nr:hypothetical protein [Sphingomonadaceae bacterium]